jgi:hypothetical protein
MLSDLSDSLEAIHAKFEAMKAVDKGNEISRMVELDHSELNLDEDSLLVATHRDVCSLSICV